MNPDDFIHVFKTFLGLPPEKNDKPICGATLTDAYDFADLRPVCPTCDRLKAEAEATMHANLSMTGREPYHLTEGHLRTRACAAWNCKPMAG